MPPLRPVQAVTEGLTLRFPFTSICTGRLSFMFTRSLVNTPRKIVSQPSARVWKDACPDLARLKVHNNANYPQERGRVDDQLLLFIDPQYDIYSSIITQIEYSSTKQSGIDGLPVANDVMIEINKPISSNFILVFGYTYRSRYISNPFKSKKYSTVSVYARHWHYGM